MYADTSYPQTIIPFRGYDPKIQKLVGFEFKQEAKFSEVRNHEYKFFHKHNEWLAQKYSFRTTNLIISEDYQVAAIDWDLGEGVHLVTQCIDPKTSSVAEDDPRVLYLLFLYRHRKEWKNANALTKLKGFIRHLEQMPGCPVKDIILRASNASSYAHLKQFDFIPSSNAQSEKLLKVYNRILGCTSYKYKDIEGIPFRKVKFRPKS